MQCIRDSVEWAKKWIEGHFGLNVGDIPFTFGRRKLASCSHRILIKPSECSSWLCWEIQ